MRGCAVTTFPMKADRKKPREELDIVNVIEWGHGSSHQRYFLLVKRPESGMLHLHIGSLFGLMGMAYPGLLAGLYDFATSANVSKNISCQAVKDTSLRLLGVLFGRTFHETTNLSSVARSESNNDVNQGHMVKISVAGDVPHVFSHIKKTYRVVWIVMTGGDRQPEFDQNPKSGESQENSLKRRNRSKASHKNFHGTVIPTERLWVPLSQVADTK